MVSRPLRQGVSLRSGRRAGAVEQAEGKKLPEIGDVDEGVVERGENAGNAEDELAWAIRQYNVPSFVSGYSRPPPPPPRFAQVDRGGG